MYHLYFCANHNVHKTCIIHMFLYYKRSGIIESELFTFAGLKNDIYDWYVYENKI